MSLRLDHITVVAPTLEAGGSHVENCLGVTPPFGGKHPRMGTHNSLMRLGDDLFLEVVAMDHAALPIGRPRWFGLDDLSADSPARLATWVVGAPRVETALAKAGPEAGAPVEITRGDLSWVISIRDDGALPLEGTMPTFIEWPEGPHPAARMMDLDCRLLALDVTSPHGTDIARAVSVLADPRVSIRPGPRTSIVARIQTPYGPRLLS